MDLPFSEVKKFQIAVLFLQNKFPQNHIAEINK